MKAEAGVQRGGGENLHAVTFGTTGPVVVLLHGFGGIGDVWQDIAGRLASSHKVIAYDLPGHGQSVDYPGGGPPKTAARAVTEDIRSRELGPVHLVGHSMGGAIAALVALGAQELITSLTLVAPGGMGADINAPLLQRFAAAQTVDEISACLADMSAPHAPSVPETAAALASARQSPAQRHKLVEIAELITRGGRQGVIPTEMLASLPMPVSVLWGTEDSVLPFAQTQNLPPNFAVSEVPGGGHMLIEEAPDALVEMLLRQIEATSTPEA